MALRSEPLEIEGTGNICILRRQVLVCVSVHLQAGALVHIYTDGSVLLTHGGTEMGQGLHTKMVQVLEIILCLSVIHLSFSQIRVFR